MTDEKRTLGGMSHTNPYTNETFGDTQTYTRGRLVAADGGEDPERDAAEEGELKDVDHEPPKNAPSASRTYMRGQEGEEDVDDVK